MSPPMPLIPFGVPFRVRRHNDRSLWTRLHSVCAALRAGSDSGSRGEDRPNARPIDGTALWRLVLAGLLLLVTLAVHTRTEPVHAADPAPAASYRLDATVDLTKASVKANTATRRTPCIRGCAAGSNGTW